MALVRPLARAIARALATPLAGGGASRQYYQFDGVNDYVTIPKLVTSDNDTLKLKYVANNAFIGANYAFFDGDDALDRCYIFDNGASNQIVYGSRAFSAKLDGVSISNGAAMPIDGLLHELEFVLKAQEIGALCGRVGNADYFVNALYDVEITSVSGNRFYPIDDTWANNPVIADTVGGQDGTAINFQEPNWVTSL